MRRQLLVAGLSSLIAALLGVGGCGNRPARPTAADHDRLYRQGVDLIQPYMQLHGVPSKVVKDKSDREKLNHGIALLEEVTRINPENWNAYWIVGKAHQALEDHEHACSSFERAFAIQKEHPDVAREYMFECLHLGRADDAIRAAKRAVQLKPEDPGLHANLAAAYLLNGQISEAQQAADKSLEMAPDDTISQYVKRMIVEVRDGKLPQPRSIGDLER